MYTHGDAQVSNAFDRANYPTREPVRLTVGDRWMWKRDDLGVDYDPAGYTLQYRARLEGDGTAEIEIDATGVSGDFIVEVASATTEAVQPGLYHWQASIVRNSDSERLTLATGRWEVAPDRDDSQGDPRSWVKVCLDAVRATLQKTATKEQASLSVEGYSLARRSPGELMELERRLAIRHQSEVRKERRRQGRRGGNTVRARFP